MNLLDQLRRDEGEVLHAYQDSLGYWTLGVGRLIDKRRGGGITRAESEILLRNDVAAAEAALQRELPWTERLDPVRRAALLNMMFQLGTAGLLRFRNTLALVERGEYERAAANAMQSLWARQTPSRARRVTQQLATGEWV